MVIPESWYVWISVELDLFLISCINLVLWIVPSPSVLLMSCSVCVVLGSQSKIQNNWSETLKGLLCFQITHYLFCCLKKSSLMLLSQKGSVWARQDYKVMTLRACWLWNGCFEDLDQPLTDLVFRMPLVCQDNANTSKRWNYSITLQLHGVKLAITCNLFAIDGD